MSGAVLFRVIGPYCHVAYQYRAVYLPSHLFPEGGRENIMVRIATLTVAVGMAVMILALAVVTGFKREVTAKLVGFGSHVRIVSLHSNASLETDPVTVDTALMESVARLPRFASVAPYAVKGG